MDGHEIPVIYESKFQNIVVNDRAYSLPFEDPRVYITFDQALQVCRNKGNGWHLHTNALWAAIQSCSVRNDLDFAVHGPQTGHPLPDIAAKVRNAGRIVIVMRSGCLFAGRSGPMFPARALRRCL